MLHLQVEGELECFLRPIAPFAAVAPHFVALEKGLGSPLVASWSRLFVFFPISGAEEGAVRARDQAVLSLTSAVGNLL